MPKEEEYEIKSKPFQVGSTPFAMPTDDKLKMDAASVVDQIIHFWNPGEVQCVVLIARPDSQRPAYAYSQMDRERVMKLLQLAEADLLLAKQKAMISGKKDRR